MRVDNSSSPITAAEPTTGSAAVHPPPGSHLNPIASQHSPPPPFHPIRAAFPSSIPFVVQECTVCASTSRPVRSLQPSRPSARAAPSLCFAVRYFRWIFFVDWILFVCVSMFSQHTHARRASAEQSGRRRIGVDRRIGIRSDRNGWVRWSGTGVDRERRRWSGHRRFPGGSDG